MKKLLLLPFLITLGACSATGPKVYVAPEAMAGGTIALVHEGDSITIDAHQLLIQLNVPDEEIARRRAAWTAPKPRYTRGVLAKFATLASTASKGAVTD
jgi:dihydroxy-acid dehydratase